MSTLIVYYSRTGHTRTIARELADALSADLEGIRETKSRTGMMGYLSAGKDATLKKAMPIEPTSINPSTYDLVIIGTPVWAFTMASGIRTWLTEHGKDLKKVAFFATMGGRGDERTFAHMQELCGQAPIATATFIDKKIAKGEYKEDLDTFVKKFIS
jgi:flavodoxin